jgi:biofilm PGA synthesis N-glycosyltransferase PgaC
MKACDLPFRAGDQAVSGVHRLDHNEPKIRCSVGVTAYNEEANIGQLLDALLEQHLYEAEIAEIIVVASGCTDNTVPIVEGYVARNPLIRLHVQPKREGKTAAINIFLANASEQICVLESGDTLPHEEAVEHMVRMFTDPTVGMVGAHKARRDDRLPQGI